jgi:hypothetical protein
MRSIIGNRRAVSALGAGLILVIMVMSMMGGVFVYYVGSKEGWWTSKAGQFGPVDGRYFPTEAAMLSYIAGKSGAATSGKFAITGKVLTIGNGTGVTSATVEIYSPSKSEAGLWDLADTCTTDGTTAIFQSGVQFDVGSRIMVHVLRSAGRKIYDLWQERTVPAGLTISNIGVASSPLGAFYVYPYPNAAGSLTITLYTGAGAVVSATEVGASYTPLSKASLATDFNGFILLGLAHTWETYGQNPFTQPKTSKGYKLREYVTAVTWTFNVTGISWQDSDWASIQVSSGMKRAMIIRNTEFSPSIVATQSGQPEVVKIKTPFVASSLADNTGVSIIIHIMDYQLWENVKDNSSTSTVGVNFGYTYDVTTTRYVRIIA